MIHPSLSAAISLIRLVEHLNEACYGTFRCDSTLSSVVSENDSRCTAGRAATAQPLDDSVASRRDRPPCKGGAPDGRCQSAARAFLARCSKTESSIRATQRGSP